MNRFLMGTALVCGVAAVASADVSDVNGFNEVPRLFNDFSGSNLTFATDYGAGTASLQENNYGAGGFANRHVAWFSSDNGASSRDFDYGDGFDISMSMTIDNADNVGQVEAGFQFDLFGLGLFGVLTGNGEIASFGSAANQFHSFGTGLYSVGETVQLRMIYTPGAGEGMAPVSTVEYQYNNVSRGTGWVSSGAIDYTNGEGGIPDGSGDIFAQLIGLGAQINGPDSVDGNVSISYSDISVAVPAPAGVALFGLGLGALARRRR